MSPFCPGDETTVVKSDWGEVIFGLWQEGEREASKSCVMTAWPFFFFFYISKLADSGFPGHTELTILVILV